MVDRNQLFILIEDLDGREYWKQVKEINLGSRKAPNLEIKQVKIIT
jgi:hypothetical protein